LLVCSARRRQTAVRAGRMNRPTRTKCLSRRCQLAVQLTVGTELVLLFQLPRNPKLVLAPAPREAFHAAPVAVTEEPLEVSVALQNCVTVWPLA